ncbi:unnamed protein product [Bursaphelenchus xylophilus]|uniref:(pine wood nematode) hypothetical protein n=1 Tax=Bursaphelenchus xylophilus TaxID=6326 RepID=A0A1I7RLD7_BURXY|nr:unnamed protein product [Bursaphelenchus xylophilus]CAG9083114.1 unnamed protein product [Bursaphelenchus xylophilus]
MTASKLLIALMVVCLIGDALCQQRDMYGRTRFQRGKRILKDIILNSIPIILNGPRPPTGYYPQGGYGQPMMNPGMGMMDPVMGMDPGMGMGMNGGMGNGMGMGMPMG